MTRSRRMAGRRLLAAVLFAAALAMLVGASPAYAYKETSDTPYPVPLGHDGYEPGTDYDQCLSCHGYSDNSGDCYDCHNEDGLGADAPQNGKGPHAGYSTGAVRCLVCHSTHASAAGSAVLLPRPTVTATCEMCHDGTGGRGVYGAISAQTSTTPGAQHRVDITDMVPGGDASTGATISAVFSGPSGTLTCGDCHSTHGSNTVAEFLGERRRVPYSSTAREAWQQTTSNRLLRNRPGNATDTVAAYGSDWCIACHQGRMKGADGAANNHPGDAAADRADAFTYSNVAKITQDASTTVTALGPLGGDNRGYLMPDRSTPPTRTAQQGTHLPICQQCHEDSRQVGTMAGSVASATPYVATLDGANAGGSPRFQNFPHETQNAHFLVENNDDLCLNCHRAE